MRMKELDCKKNGGRLLTMGQTVPVAFEIKKFPNVNANLKL